MTRVPRITAWRSLIALSAALLLLVTWHATVLRRAERQFWWRGLSGTATFLAQFLDRWVVERASDVRTLALLPLQCDAAPGDGAPNRMLDSAIATALPGGSQPLAWIVDRSGRVVSRTTTALDPTDAELAAAVASFPGQASLTTSLSATALQVSFVAPLAGAEWRCGTRPLTNGSEGLVLVLRTRIDSLIAPLAGSTLRASVTARTLFIERHGDTVNAVVTRQSRDTTRPRLRGVRLGLHSAPPQIAAAAAAHDTTLLGTDFEGRPTMAAVRHAKHIGWSIVRQMDEAEVYRRASTQSAIEASLAVTVIAAFWLVVIAQERAARIRRLRVRLLRVQLETLKAQLRPHFLFNALNAVVELITRDPHQAELMLLRLSQLLRVSLQSRGTQVVELRSELEMVEAYAEVEQLRFRDRLHVELDIPQELMGALVPSLVLQPLVENGIRHGIGGRQGAGLVRVAAHAVEERLILSVEDNGAGLGRSGAAHGLGVGLRNTRRRLRRLYGARHEFHLTDRAEGGVRATVVLPLRFGTDSSAHLGDRGWFPFRGRRFRRTDDREPMGSGYSSAR